MTIRCGDSYSSHGSASALGTHSGPEVVCTLIMTIHFGDVVDVAKALTGACFEDGRTDGGDTHEAHQQCKRHAAFQPVFCRLLYHHGQGSHPVIRLFSRDPVAMTVIHKFASQAAEFADTPSPAN
eukprot:7329160-Prymnesium_polylepis.1